jgi:hypothetical protein
VRSVCERSESPLQIVRTRPIVAIPHIVCLASGLLPLAFSLLLQVQRNLFILIVNDQTNTHIPFIPIRQSLFDLQAERFDSRADLPRMGIRERTSSFGDSMPDIRKTQSSAIDGHNPNSLMIFGFVSSRDLSSAFSVFHDTYTQLLLCRAWCSFCRKEARSVQRGCFKPWACHS